MIRYKVCPICNFNYFEDSKAEWLLGLHLIRDQAFRIFCCKQCRFRWLDPLIPNDEILKLYSEKYFEDQTRSYSYADQVIETKKIFVENAQYFRDRTPGGKILDIGCATGEFLEIANKIGLNSVGLEISEYGYSKCLEKGKYTAEVEKDIKAGMEAGVNSTPSFVINGRPVSGALSLNHFKEIIDEELARN